MIFSQLLISLYFAVFTNYSIKSSQASTYLGAAFLSTLETQSIFTGLCPTFTNVDNSYCKGIARLMHAFRYCSATTVESNGN